MKLILAFITAGCLNFVPPAYQKKVTVHIVRMEGMKFVPKVLEIKAGDKVQWVNDTYSQHNVVASNGSFKSTMLSERGQVFEFTFTSTGSFNYYCQPHKLMGMKGTIVVN